MTDWKWELAMLLRVGLAAVFGAIIGWDRERQGHSAGIRTHAALALGACVFALVSMGATGTKDVTRIAAQVVSGIGFLCAGVIIHERGKAKGLTTAATLWATAAVGLSVGFGYFVLSGGATLLLVGLLVLQHLPVWKKVAGSSEEEKDD
jgi:putative Mg2+ transporter-C (MgtC) family protein